MAREQAAEDLGEKVGGEKAARVAGKIMKKANKAKQYWDAYECLKKCKEDWWCSSKPKSH
jgi:hypothetical protein